MSPNCGSFMCFNKSSMAKRNMLHHMFEGSIECIKG